MLKRKPLQKKAKPVAKKKTAPKKKAAPKKAISAGRKATAVKKKTAPAKKKATPSKKAAVKKSTTIKKAAPAAKKTTVKISSLLKKETVPQKPAQEKTEMPVVETVVSAKQKDTIRKNIAELEEEKTPEAVEQLSLPLPAIEEKKKPKGFFKKVKGMAAVRNHDPHHISLNKVKKGGPKPSGKKPLW